MMIQDDSDDEITRNADLDSDDIILYSVDCLEENQLYPVQAKENLYSDGYVQKINVISSDDELAKIIVDGGKILSSDSHWYC